MAPETDPAATSWIDGVIALAALALAGLIGSAVVRNADIWQHLAAGRMIARGELPFGAEPFNFTTAGQTWVNHAWGFDLGLYHVHESVGPAGVVATRAILVVLMAIAILLTRRPGAGLALPATAAAIAVVAANARLPFYQPSVVSCLALALLAFWLHWSPRWSGWWGPAGVFLLQGYWVNHDAWFMLGPVLVLAYAVGSMCESRSRVGWWMTMAIAAVAGSLCNPWHVRAFVMPDELVPSFFAVPVPPEGFFQGYLANPLDGRYALRAGPAPAWAFFALLVIGIISFIANLPARPWGRLAVWAVLAGLACWRSRFVPFFAIGATAFATLNLQDSLARLPMTPNRHQLGIFGRAVAALGVLALCGMAWPGWLGPRSTDPSRVARVGLRLDVDPGLVAVATELAQKKEADRCFTPAPEAACILAWYAPQVKTFVDPRWRLHADRVPEFVEARAPFPALELGRSADFAATEATFRKHEVNSLLLVAPERVGGPAARALFAAPDRIPLLAMAGRATAFRTRPGPVGLDPVPLAFAPQAAKAPVGLPDDDPRQPSDWDKYLQGPPSRPPELDESATWVEYAEANETRFGLWMQAAQMAGIAGAAGLPPAALRYPATTLVSPRTAPPADRLAAGVLAVRAARAARNERPDDAEASYRLAAAVKKFGSLESLSQLQYSSALQQARTRLPIGTAWGRDDVALAFELADRSAQWHMSRNHGDLALQDFKDALRLLNTPEVASKFDANAWQQTTAARRKQIDQIDQEVAARKEQLDRQTQNQPLMARVGLAVRMGLPGLALTELQQAAVSPDTAKSIDLLSGIEIMLRVGQAEEARRFLRMPAFEPITAVAPARRTEVRALKLKAAIGCGDDARAIEEINALLDEGRAREQDARRFALCVIAGLGVGLDSTAQPALARTSATVVLQRGFEEAVTVDFTLAERFELLSWRGLLALQAGDTRAARRSFTEALALPPTPGREVIELYQAQLGIGE